MNPSPCPVPVPESCFLEVQDVSKCFGETLCVEIEHIHVCEGEVLALLGPSGCGKTTTLRLIAGLEIPDRGRISLAGQEVSGERVFVPPEKRKLGLVFQDYALFPHLTVAQNIRFGLQKVQGDVDARVQEMLELTRLSRLSHRFPHELSGGEQQRTALARCLAPYPRMLLLDEPFSSLDAFLRKELRAEVKEILQEIQITTILVTHDQEEALSMSDHLAVMLHGTVQQVGTPRELYWSPIHEDIARFMGEVNLLPGWASGHEVECVLGRLPIQKRMEGAVQVMLRPETLYVDLGNEGRPGRVLDIEFYGHYQILSIALDTGERLLARRDAIQPFLPGQQIAVQPAGIFPVFPMPQLEGSLRLQAAGASKGRLRRLLPASAGDRQPARA